MARAFPSLCCCELRPDLACRMVRWRSRTAGLVGVHVAALELVAWSGTVSFKLSPVRAGLSGSTTDGSSVA